MALLSRTITNQRAGCRVQTVLKNDFHLSTTCINRLKRTESGITVNGRRAFTNAVLDAGDVLCVDLSAAEQPTKIEPVDIPLDILYEDDHLLILNKQPLLPVIPSSLSHDEPTLANALAHHWQAPFTFHPVNRLDRGTSGLMVVARHSFAHDQLQRVLHSGNFTRRYLAICVGSPETADGEIVLPIARKEGSAIARCVSPDGQYARSTYRTLAKTERFSLLELTPHTGRTHQLRVHMAALSHPLVGDWLYGTEDHALIARPALHSAYLRVTHPVTGELIEYTAPLPADMKQLMELI